MHFYLFGLANIHNLATIKNPRSVLYSLKVRVRFGLTDLFVLDRYFFEGLSARSQNMIDYQTATHIVI